MKLFKNRAEKLKEKKRQKEIEELRRDINNLEMEMKQNEVNFNLITDEYLLDSVIYEHNAQTAKMNYLLREAKKIN